MPMIAPYKVPYSGPNNPFAHSLLRTSQLLDTILYIFQGPESPIPLMKEYIP